MSEGNLSGRKILIPEDDYLQAMTIAETLAEHGAEVVGPFSAPEKSLLNCERDLIDAAVLDIKIGEADSFPIADQLLREGIPFIFLTGYDRNILPDRFQRLPH